MVKNFGKEMAEQRRLEKERLYDRLRSAKKIVFESQTWSFQGDKWLQTAVRTIQAQGFRAELRWEEEKLQLYAVQYKGA